MPDSGAGSRDRSTRGKITAAGYRADGFGQGKFGFGWFRACGGHLGEVERRVKLSHGVFVFCTRSITVALMSTERGGGSVLLGRARHALGRRPFTDRAAHRQASHCRKAHRNAEETTHACRAVVSERGQPAASRMPDEKRICTRLAQPTHRTQRPGPGYTDERNTARASESSKRERSFDFA